MLNRQNRNDLQWLALMSVASICFLATSALAEETPGQFPDMQATPEFAAAPPQLPLWEAGGLGFGYTQPAYPGAEDRASRLLVFPYVIYRGKYLRADRSTVGLRAIKTPRIEADLGFAGALGSHSADIAIRKGMADLGTMIEFGPRLKIKLGDMSSGRSDSRLQFSLRKVLDVSHGFSSNGIAFEPQWVNDRKLGKQWFFSTNLGAMFGDSRLADTFYGVAPYETTPTRPSYTAKSGLIALSAGLSASNTLTPDVRMFYMFRFESLAGAANRDSPLVRRESGWSAGIGLIWTLARSEKKAID